MKVEKQVANGGMAIITPLLPETAIPGFSVSLTNEIALLLFIIVLPNQLGPLKTHTHNLLLFVVVAFRYVPDHPCLFLKLTAGLMEAEA